LHPLVLFASTRLECWNFHFANNSLSHDQPALPALAWPAGYSFYSHLVSTRMLPLRRMVRWTRAAQGQLSFEPGDRRALFAASHK
jgi:hypothetical protein